MIDLADFLSSCAPDVRPIFERAERRAEKRHRESVRKRYGWDVRSFSVLGLKRHSLMAVVRKTEGGYSATCPEFRLEASGPTARSACVAVAEKASRFVEQAQRLGNIDALDRALTEGFQYPSA